MCSGTTSRPADRRARTAATLAPEAKEAHARLSRHAATLANLSASFAKEALAVADSYAGALAGGTRESWTSFVAAAASVAGYGASIALIMQLSAREQAAYEFFAQIAHENIDLLGVA